MSVSGSKPPSGFFKRREDLSVRYYPGIGSGGTDEILRPTLMTVGNQGRCYRIVNDTFGKKENQMWNRTTTSSAIRVEDQVAQNEEESLFQGSSYKGMGHHGNSRKQESSKKGKHLPPSHRPHFQGTIEVCDRGLA